MVKLKRKINLIKKFKNKNQLKKGGPLFKKILYHKLGLKDVIENNQKNFKK